VKFISRVENNRRKKEIEEDGIFEGDHTLNHHSWTYSNNQSNNHPCHESKSPGGVIVPPKIETTVS
jgi:hypothetical protein